MIERSFHRPFPARSPQCKRRWFRTLGLGRVQCVRRMWLRWHANEMKFKRCLNFIFPVVDIYVIIPSAYRTEGRDATERSLAVIVMTTLLFLFADHRVHHRLVSECFFFVWLPVDGNEWKS